VDKLPGVKTTKRQGGKKSRKIGRSSRKPSHNRYNAQERWVRNKERRMAKQAKKEAKKKAKKERLALAQLRASSGTA
jgi:protein required for attachment to host cells